MGRQAPEFGLLIMLIALIVISAILGSIEAFATELGGAPVVYTTNKVNHINWIAEWNRKADIRIITDAEVDGIIEDPRPQMRPSRPATDSFICLSKPIAIKKGFGDSEPIASSGKGYFVRLTLPEIAHKETCAFDFKGRRIGYLTEDDKYMIQAIIAAYRIPERSVQLVNIPMSQWMQFETLFRTGVVDLVITNVIAGSPFSLLLQIQSILIDGFKGIDPERMRLFYPWGKLVNMPKETLRRPSSKNLVGQGDVFEMQMGLYPLENTGAREAFADVTHEAFADVTRLEYDRDAMDPAFKCYGNKSIESKAHCMSAYNEIGERKRKPTAWDRPCLIDEDCPFYTGEHGGCEKGSGVCELPIGVKRIGFRLHDASGTNAPFCYAPNGDCGINGDYAFEKDGRVSDIML